MKRTIAIAAAALTVGVVPSAVAAQSLTAQMRAWVQTIVSRGELRGEVPHTAKVTVVTPCRFVGQGTKTCQLRGAWHGDLGHPVGITVALEPRVTDGPYLPISLTVCSQTACETHPVQK